MSFLKSLVFGSEGSYKIFGIPVSFEKKDPSIEIADIEGAGFISKLANNCLNSIPFRLITQGYAHVCIHEMSHAIAIKLLTNESPYVHICTDTCTGYTRSDEDDIFEPELWKDNDNIEAEPWKDNIIHAAGSIGNVAFSSCELIAATAFKNYLSWPVALALGGGGALWLSGELLYSYVSAIRKDNGDFGQIASSHKMHLALAGAALVGECALGVLAAVKAAG